MKRREVGEIWRRVVRFPDLYEVSSDGRVRSIDGRLIVRSDGVSQRRPGRILRHRSRPSGHQTVKLDHGKQARKEVCKRGHPLQGANLIKSAVNPTWRGCLACRKAHNARRQRGRVLRNFDGIDMQAEADRQFARIMMEAS